MVMLGLSALATVGIILVLPVSEATRGQLLGFLGILFSAAIALSSTTILGNALAGIMMRAVKSFRVGDFVRVEGHFGRVSERGLFHVEIQTEERELVTLPNLYLVTHPVTTIRSSGTMITAELTLGYDVPRGQAEELLLGAANDAGLGDSFVQILDLGDFSVKYRVAGLLEEVKYLVSARSLLRGKILDRFHDAGVEIVSPNFMNTRMIQDGTRIIPEMVREAPVADASPPPEELIFDKAEEAGAVEALKGESEGYKARIAELEAVIKDASEAEKVQAKTELDTLQGKVEELEQTILTSENALATGPLLGGEGVAKP